MSSPVTSQGRHRRALPTAALVAGIAALAVLSGLLLFGLTGVVLLGIGLAVAARAQQATRSSTVLRALRARPLHRWEAPGVLDAVAGLSARAGLPRPPTVALVPTPMVNAFATGTPDDAVVALSPRLLQVLTPRQVVAVLAHEISHVSAADLRVMGLAAALARFTQTVSTAGTFLLLLAGPGAFATGLSAPVLLAVLWAPTAATLLLLALSRAREHGADEDAVALTGDPEGLAQALWVMEHHTGAMWEATDPDRSLPPWWLRTHPTTEARIARLRRLPSRTAPPAPPVRPLSPAA